MQNLSTGARRRRTLGAACALAFAASVAAAGSASAAPVVKLRVEADNTALVPGGRSFVTGRTRFRTDSRTACGGKGKVVELPEATALGTLDSAARITPTLQPLGVSDQFDFGLFVCGIGRYVGDFSKFWLYKVNHDSPEVGADQFKVKSGDQVFWYFVDSTRQVNTGEELQLVAPDRQRSGQPVDVAVFRWDAAGRRRPAAGAKVVGPTTQTTDANGRARFVVSDNRRIRLRAIRGTDIPSSPEIVCVNERLSRCPTDQGERIFGTNAGELLVGTGAPDVVFGRQGNDRINVRGGGRDRVDCGTGRDRVRADRRDKVSRNCERVIRPRRRL